MNDTQEPLTRIAPAIHITTMRLPASWMSPNWYARWDGDDGYHYEAGVWEREETGPYLRVRCWYDADGRGLDCELVGEVELPETTDILRLVANGWEAPAEVFEPTDEDRAEAKLQEHRRLVVRQLASAEVSEGHELNRYQAAMIRALLDRGVGDDDIYAALLAADDALGRMLFA